MSSFLFLLIVSFVLGFLAGCFSVKLISKYIIFSKPRSNSDKVISSLPRKGV
jgi:uncharacterized protein YneF (UPF0154 family)